METWQSALLRATLQTLTTSRDTPQPLSLETPPLQAAQILQQAIPLSALTALHALCPKAATAAFADIDDAVQKISLADLVDSSGTPLPRPPILSSLACGFVEKESGHVLVKVKSHVVLIRDLRWRQGFEIHPAEQLDDVFCDCKAFEFAAEVLCKHCVVAFVSLPLLQVKVVEEDEFLELMGEDVQTAVG